MDRRSAPASTVPATGAIAYGAVGDYSSQAIGVLAAVATAALIVPMVFGLRRPLAC